MLVRLLTLLSVVCGLIAGAFAQQACSSIEVPVGVISASGESFRGLTAESFVTSNGPVVKSLTYDNGPRRVLFIVDTSTKLSANVHRAAAEMLDSLVAASRPEDLIALITARGPGGLVKFGEDRS